MPTAICIATRFAILRTSYIIQTVRCSLYRGTFNFIQHFFFRKFNKFKVIHNNITIKLNNKYNIPYTYLTKTRCFWNNILIRLNFCLIGEFCHKKEIIKKSQRNHKRQIGLIDFSNHFKKILIISISYLQRYTRLPPNRAVHLCRCLMQN